MARDYRTLKLEILAETKQFVADMKTGETQVESFGDKAKKMGAVAAAAFAAAAAAAAAYAGKLAIEGVKAAIEDEAAQVRLANALKNVTDATNTQIAAVEEQITQMSLAFGIADDQLRPAFQRLATATGSLSEANKGLSLALDISAATGKSVEAVSNALAKAYEGNTSSLGRLGIGLSSTEIKTLGLEGTMAKLSETFAGAATKNANTLEGQIARLRVGFDEAKESVGAALLPTVQKLLDFVVNQFIPKLTALKDKVITPITTAIEDNKEAFSTLVQFMSKYVIPIIVDGFGKAFTGVAKVIAGVISIIGNVIEAIETGVKFAISAVNKLIEVYNAVPILPDINKISTPSFSAPDLSTSSGNVSIPSVSTPSISTPSVPSASSATSAGKTAAATGYTMAVPTGPAANAAVSTNLGDIRKADNVIINVNAPSVIDRESFKTAVVDALNEAENRGTGGAGSFRFSASVAG